MTSIRRVLRSTRRALAQVLSHVPLVRFAGCYDCDVPGAEMVVFYADGSEGWTRCHSCACAYMDDPTLDLRHGETEYVWAWIQSGPVYSRRRFEAMYEDLFEHSLPFFPPVAA